MIEVIISLALLGLFAALAFGLLQSTHLQLFRGNKQAEVGHVTQTAVEHFKAYVRSGALPQGGCPDGEATDDRYCYPVVFGYWAVYEYASSYDDVDGLYKVDLSVVEDAGGALGDEAATFSFLVWKEGF